MRSIFSVFLLLLFSLLTSCRVSQTVSPQGNAEGFDARRPILPGKRYVYFQPGFTCQKEGKTIATYADSVVFGSDGTVVRTGNECMSLSEPVSKSEVEAFLTDEVLRVQGGLYDLDQGAAPGRAAEYTEAYCQFVPADLEGLSLDPLTTRLLSGSGFGVKVTANEASDLRSVTSFSFDHNQISGTQAVQRSLTDWSLNYLFFFRSFTQTGTSKVSYDSSSSLQIVLDGRKTVESAVLDFSAESAGGDFPISCWVDLRS